MAFREKMAWLELLSLVGAYACYALWLGSTLQSGAPSAYEVLVRFTVVSLYQAVVVTIIAVVLAARDRREANAPADERDRSLERRGAAIAYYVLLTGLFLMVMMMPFGAPTWLLINLALLTLVVGEAVRLSLVVTGYRRGLHG